MTTSEIDREDRQPQETGFEGRWNLIRRIHRNNRLFYRGMGLLLLFILGLFYFTDGYTTNAYTEALSILVTVFWLNELAANRSERQLKEELITDMGGQSNEFALRAVRLLRKKEWLLDGSLKNAYLNFAELQNALLYWANLQSVSLENANLKNANFIIANLQNAKLIRADLQSAQLFEANLAGADLERANLQGANLWEANLQGANLYESNVQDAIIAGADLRSAFLVFANLQGAKIGGVHFDETTTLPDGTQWHEGVDLSEFVNGTWQGTLR